MCALDLSQLAGSPRASHPSPWERGVTVSHSLHGTHPCAAGALTVPEQRLTGRPGLDMHALCLEEPGPRAPRREWGQLPPGLPPSSPDSPARLGLQAGPPEYSRAERLRPSAAPAWSPARESQVLMPWTPGWPSQEPWRAPVPAFSARHPVRSASRTPGLAVAQAQQPPICRAVLSAAQPHLGARA